MTNEHFQSIKDRSRRDIVAVRGYPMIEAMADVHALIDYIEGQVASPSGRIHLPSDASAKALTDFALSEPISDPTKIHIGELLSECDAMRSILTSQAVQIGVLHRQVDAYGQLERARRERVADLEEKIEKLENSR